MRAETNKAKHAKFMTALGGRVRGPGRIYLTGGATAKLQRRHDRDLRDVQSSLRAGLIQTETLREMFAAIRPQLIRYPAIDPASFERAVVEFCDANR